MAVVVFGFRPKPFKGTDLPNTADVTKENDTATTLALAMLGALVPPLGVFGAAVSTGKVETWAGVCATAACGLCFLTVAMALYHGPRPDWDVPAAKRDAFARRQIGMVKHRRLLAKRSVLYLALSYVAVAVTVSQGFG